MGYKRVINKGGNKQDDQKFEQPINHAERYERAKNIRCNNEHDDQNFIAPL